jgi:hypothetical protein
MNRVPLTFALGLAAVLAGPAHAQESGGFVVRLGNDTTSVERYTRTASRIEIEQTGRAPRVLTRKYVFELGKDGATTRATATVAAPDAAPGARPMQAITATYTADSAITEIRRDTTVQWLRATSKPGMIAYTNTAPWAMYEQMTMKLAAGKEKSVRASTLWFASTQQGWIVVQRLGPDSMLIQTNNDTYRARVDRDGRIQKAVPVSGTQGFSADRLPSLDVPAMTANFLAREKQAGAMGQLSTRDTLQATAGGAALWIDYGRPAVRGRVIFGSVVPWGQVWRLGANAATQFRTDKALKFGEVTIPAGFYSLFAIPGPTMWTVIVNKQTGQPGTSYDAAQDFARVSFAVSKLPESVERLTVHVVPTATGGALQFDWAMSRASADFTVVP